MKEEGYKKLELLSENKYSLIPFFLDVELLMKKRDTSAQSPE